MKVSPENFYLLSKKYFTGLDTNNGKFEFTVEPDDKDSIYSFLRVHYGLWVETNKLSITIHAKFPDKFI